MMARLRCPICERAFESDNSPTIPFCSDRCRRIDMGRWLGEDYSVPIQRSDDEEEELDPDE